MKKSLKIHKLPIIFILAILIPLTIFYLNPKRIIYFPWEEYPLEHEAGSTWINLRVEGMFMNYKNLFKIPYNPMFKFKETKSKFNKTEIISLIATNKLTGGEIFTFVTYKSNNNSVEPIPTWESLNRESRSLLIDGINWTHYLYSKNFINPYSWQTLPDMYEAKSSDYTIVFSTYNRGYNQILMSKVLPSLNIDALTNLFK